MNIYDSGTPDIHQFGSPSQQLTIAPQFIFAVNGPIEEVCRLNNDGTLTVNPKYSVGEAATLFWKYAMEMAKHGTGGQ